MASPTAKGRPSQVVNKIKQLYLVREEDRAGAELAPFILVEARIDFNDVRTGFRETVSLSKALEVYSDNADLLWTDDMVWDVDSRKIAASVPAGTSLGELPEFVDANFCARMENQFIQYLLRSFEIKIFRNFELNLYSFAGETHADFCRRCLEVFDVQRRQEVDALHDVFDRRLEQIRQKYLRIMDPAGLEQARSESRNRNTFSRYSERISQLFNETELGPEREPEPRDFSSDRHELDERLRAIESEACQTIARLRDRYREKARAVDEYILHPNLKDIHFARSCILWMPKGTA